MMHVSAAGRELIGRNEGDKLAAYRDSVGVWTIGKGDTGPDVVEGLTITQDESDTRFANRLAREFEPAVSKAIGDAPTTQGQFDAMVSLSYNIGTGGFAKSSVCRLHKAGDYEGAANAFALWNKAGGRVLAGLTRRRQEEADLYLSDVSPTEEAEQPVAALSDAGTAGHQKAVAGTLAVQCTSLFDKFQSLFTGLHMDMDTIMLVAAVAVGLAVWKINASHKVKA